MDDPIDPKNMVDLFDLGGPATEPRDQPVPPTAPSQTDTPEGRSGRRLTSHMLLGARGVPGPTPPPRPDFDVVTNGLDAEQVQQYLETLLGWAQRQVHRAEGAEQTLAEAVTHLRDATTATTSATATNTSATNTATPANGARPTGTDGAQAPNPAPLPRKAPRSAEPAKTANLAATEQPSVPRPRLNGQGAAPAPRPDESVAGPRLRKRSPSARPSGAVSRLDDRLVGAALTGLLGGSRWDQFRGRRSPWSAFHLRSLTPGSRQARYTIVAGPSGLFSLSTPYHRGAEIVVDGSRVLVDGQESADAAPMIDGAHRAGELLTGMLSQPEDTPTAPSRPPSPTEIVVRPVLAFVGVRSVRIERPGPLVVTTTANLAAYLRALPDRLTDTELQTIGALGRRSRSESL